MRYAGGMIGAFCLVLSACASTERGMTTTNATLCEDPRPQICTMDYRPVCAILKDGGVKTYSNGCGACADVNALSWVEGACPE